MNKEKLAISIVFVSLCHLTIASAAPLWAGEYEEKPAPELAVEYELEPLPEWEVDKESKPLPEWVWEALPEPEPVSEKERIRLAEIPVLEDKSADGWSVEQPTFDYIIPCGVSGTRLSAIVVHGTNHMDLLTDNGEPELTYEWGVSNGNVYSRMAEFCISIVQPKSGLSTVVETSTRSKNYGKADRYRTWWMSEAALEIPGVPFRYDHEEVNAIIEAIKIQKNKIGKPVYLVYGNGDDAGFLMEDVIDKLDENGESNLVRGFIIADDWDGEFTVYNSGSKEIEIELESTDYN